MPPLIAGGKIICAPEDVTDDNDNVVVHAGDVVGYSSPTVGASVGNPVAVEIWSKAIVKGKPASGTPYWHWAFPYVRVRYEGDREFTNGALANEYSGTGSATRRSPGTDSTRSTTTTTSSPTRRRSPTRSATSAPRRSPTSRRALGAVALAAPESGRRPPTTPSAASRRSSERPQRSLARQAPGHLRVPPRRRT